MPLTQQKISKIQEKEILVNDLDNQELGEFCEFANTCYRAGNPIISDEDYDFIFLKALKNRLPEHHLLKNIEPEDNTFSDEKVLLPQAMLSIDKAYSFNEIIKWTERILKAANDLNFDPALISFIATPKLDGFAGFDDGIKLYTRGDGKKGSDITRVFNRGLKVFNNSERGQGAGEIVVSKSYFEKNLAQYFEFPQTFKLVLLRKRSWMIMQKMRLKIMVPFLSLLNNYLNGMGHCKSSKLILMT